MRFFVICSGFKVRHKIFSTQLHFLVLLILLVMN